MVELDNDEIEQILDKAKEIADWAFEDYEGVSVTKIGLYNSVRNTRGYDLLVTCDVDREKLVNSWKYISLHVENEALPSKNDQVRQVVSKQIGGLGWRTMDFDYHEEMHTSDTIDEEFNLLGVKSWK